MIQIKAEHETYLEIYSDKLIYEPSINKYWQTSEKNPIAVDKNRYTNNDYIEAEETDLEFEKVFVEPVEE